MTIDDGWTKTAPNLPGYYWWLDDELEAPQIVLLFIEPELGPGIHACFMGVGTEGLRHSADLARDGTFWPETIEAPGCVSITPRRELNA